MPTPQVILTPLILLIPQGIGQNQTLSIDTSVLPYSVITDLNTSQLEINIGNNQYVNQTPTPHAQTAPITETALSGTVLTVQVANNLQPGQQVTLEGTAEAFLNAQMFAVVTANSTSFTAVLTGQIAFTNTSDTGTATWTNQNLFVGSIPVDTTVSDSTVQLIGRNYDPILSWVASTTYKVGQHLVDSNGNAEVATQAGTTGSSQPTWNSTVGGVTNDPTSAGVIWTNAGVLAVTPIFKFSLIFFQTSDALAIAPPSAVKSYNGLTSSRLEWQLPSYDGFVGVRVMISTDPTGVNVPFTQFGDLVNNITRSANVVVASRTTSAVNGSSTVSTTTETTEVINYSSVDIPTSAVSAQQFYAVVTTVLQDPVTLAMFESQQNGPITCGFVNLRLVQPTDFLALQRKEDIAARLITQITKIYPQLDLTPRSEIPDLMIGPFALELSNMSVREWFSRVSSSISAISLLDDPNGTGTSQPFNQSAFKQQVSRAFGLPANDTQTLIDKQFDILGERAGLIRGGSQQAVATLTFYTFVFPQLAATFGVGASCSTVPDSQTPSVVFQTTGSATITPATANSFFNAEKGWWAVDIPAQCVTPGSIGNVGAGSIRTITSGGPSGWNVLNQNAAGFGVDNQSNANFAEQIAARLVTGNDSSRRNAYLVTARSTPGVVNALVVAGGDLEMLRDWDPIRQKHIFGKVDIYVEGTTTSEQDTDVFFQYANNGFFNNSTTWSLLTATNQQLMKFQITNFAQLANLPFTAVQVMVARAANSFFFGTQNAQFDNVNGFLILDPNEMAYTLNGTAVTQVRAPLLVNGNPATNRVALAALASAQANTYSFAAFFREESPLSLVPTLQPVQSVDSITGATGQTGLISPQYVELIHTSNFYLEGLSQDAGDTIEVPSTISAATTKNLVASTSSPVLIDSAMDVVIDANGVPQNVLSVRSSDLSTLFVFGQDYTIVPQGPYHQYGLNLLLEQANILSITINVGVITVEANNTLLPGTQVTFSEVTTATFLNSQVVTVSSATPTSFTANFNYTGSFNLTQVANAVSGATVYTGIFAGGANNAYLGQTFITSGFVNSVNNGTFVCSASTTTSITLANAAGVAEIHAGLAQTTTYPQISDSGIVTFNNIANGSTVVVGYNKFILSEHLTFVANEEQTLNGNDPTTLDNTGFVHNTWIPESYTGANGDATTLTLDGAVLNEDGSLNLQQSIQAGSIFQGTTFLGYSTLIAAQILHDSRYIKVTFNDGVADLVKTEGLDYTLTVDPTSGSATIARILTGTIPDGAVVKVSYFVTETFTISDEYPAYVQILANTLETTRAAGADVLVKAMVENHVDVSITVELAANADPDTVDPNLRTAISITMDNAKKKLKQASVIQQVMGVTGVSNVEQPLLKFCKSNGAYDIGVIIPTDTSWLPLGQDPAFSSQQIPLNAFITTAAALPDATIPSGGLPNSFVGLLYQGQEYRRATSIQDFLTNSGSTPSFYIVGTNDQINPTTLIPGYAQRVLITEPAVTSPALRSYFITYQVFNEGGAKDIDMSSTEFLVPGTVTINYISATTSAGF